MCVSTPGYLIMKKACVTFQFHQIQCDLNCMGSVYKHEIMITSSNKRYVIMYYDYSGKVSMITI